MQRSNQKDISHPFCMTDKKFKYGTSKLVQSLTSIIRKDHNLTTIVSKGGQVRGGVIQVYMVMAFQRHFQQYFSYIVAVSFIGGGNWRNREKKKRPVASH